MKETTSQTAALVAVQDRWPNAGSGRGAGKPPSASWPRKLLLPFWGSCPRPACRRSRRGRRFGGLATNPPTSCAASRPSTSTPPWPN